MKCLEIVLELLFRTLPAVLIAIGLWLFSIPLKKISESKKDKP